MQSTQPEPAANYGNVHEGALYIDVERGVVSFIDKNGGRLLRVTHLPTPIPPGMAIDVVAIQQVTSYTSVLPKSGLAEWKDRNG